MPGTSVPGIYERMNELGTSEKRRMEMRFFLVYVALFTPYAVLTPYLQQLLHLYGFEHDAIGYIQGAVELMGVLAPPVWGLLSDRLRAPRLVLCATILLCIPAILLLRPGQGLVLALGIALLIGFFNKPSISLTDGLTFGHFRRNGCDYGHVRIGGTIGFVLSLVLFERVLNISGDTTGRLIVSTLIGALLFQAVMVWVVPRLPRETETSTASDAPQKESLPWRRMMTPTFIWLIVAAFLARFAMMSYYSFFTRYLKEVYHCENVGYVWLMGSMAEFPVVFWSRQIMARIGVKRMFMLAMIGTVLRLWGFACESTLWVTMSMQLLHALTFGAYHCSTLTYVSRAFPAKFQGSVQTIYAALTVGLGSVCGSSVAGLVLQHSSYFAMYLSFGCIAMVALIISLFLDLDGKKQAFSE